MRYRISPMHIFDPFFNLLIVSFEFQRARALTVNIHAGTFFTGVWRSSRLLRNRMNKKREREREREANENSSRGSEILLFLPYLIPVSDSYDFIFTFVRLPCSAWDSAPLFLFTYTHSALPHVSFLRHRSRFDSGPFSRLAQSLIRGSWNRSIFNYLHSIEHKFIQY